MSNTQYTEEQKTPWFSGADLPIRPGRYEMRMRGSKDVVDGTFSDGRWEMEYYGQQYPVPTNLRTFEWRGLNAEPKDEAPKKRETWVMINGEIIFS